MGKTETRNTFIELRSDLSVEEVNAKSQRIAETLQNTLDWSNISRLHAYTCVTKWNEVKTAWLADLVRKDHPSIHLEFSNPDRSSPIPTGHFEAIIVPLLAFDHDLNRIGFGGGWYDRFLSTQPDALKIGLAFDVQRTDQLPIEDHDVPLDMVITETAVYRR